AQVAGNLTTSVSSNWGDAFRYTLGAVGPEVFTFNNTGIAGLNDSGWMCSGVPNPKPGAKPPYFVATRYSTTYETFSNSNSVSMGINSAGDVAILDSQLYSQGLGLLDIDNLLVGNQDDIALYLSGSSIYGLSERGVNADVPGFPALWGMT